MFSREIYITRRKKLKETLKKGVFLFPGNGESSMNYKDNWYPFKQDSTFLYYTGINNRNDIYFLIDVDNDQEIIFGNDPNPEEMVWTGAVIPLSEMAEKSGITTVMKLDELPNFIKKKQEQGHEIEYLPPYRGDMIISLSKLLKQPVDRIIKKKSVSLIRAVAKQRSIKSSEEIEEICRAVNITASMHKHAIINTSPGKTEKEIAGELQAIAIAGGGNISFPIILTANGQYLHNHATENIIKEGDIILCDCGAETSMGYAGDMTRTFPAGKNFSSIQKEIYSIVLNAHNSAVMDLKPGAVFKDVHFTACSTLAEGLKDMGLMKGDINEAVSQGAHTLFFQCGLGHMMGMDVHDMENLGEEFVGYSTDIKKSKEFGLKSLRLAKALEPGNVLTVEPGLYFNPFLIDAWRAEKKLKDFINYDEVEKFRNKGGYRVEEDFVITQSGAELLGAPLAKTPEAIEELKF